MVIQSRYDDAKIWDMVLVNLDHLNDPEPLALLKHREHTVDMPHIN